MKKAAEKVTAVIELKITPAKDTGFAKIAQRIAKASAVRRMVPTLPGSWTPSSTT